MVNNNGIEKIQDLDPEKVKASIDKFGAETVKQTLVDRGIEGITQADVSTTEETATAIAEQEQVAEPAIVPDTTDKTIPSEGVVEEPVPTPEPTPTPETKAPPTVPGAIPGVVPEAEPEAPEVPEVPKEKSEAEIAAEQQGYSFDKDDEGVVTFTPKDLDEVISLYEQFGTDFKIDPNSKEAIIGSQIYQTYSKYKSAPESVYLEGLKTNEIGVGGETWDRLVKMNGGQPTAAMLAAQAKYDTFLKVNNINDTSSIISGTTVTPLTDSHTTTLDDLDNAYIAKINELFGERTADWEEYKKGTEKMEKLNDSMTDTVADIDELNVEKREVIDNLKKRYPGMDLSQILTLADKELDAIDDQLFVLQRQYNSDMSTYTFEAEKAKGDFEFQQNEIQAKMDIMSSMYGIQRGDIIREEGIAREDRLYERDIARQDELLQQQYDKADADYARAIADGNTQMARDIAYQKEMLDYQKDLNKSAQDDIINLGGQSYLENVNGRWELRSGATLDVPESTVTPSGKITQVDFTTPVGTEKILKIDAAAKSSLEALIKQFQLEVPGGDQITIGDSLRTTAEQKALHDAFLAGTGGQAAAPGTSKHETGLAIDIYANQNLDPLTTEQVEVMNQNGWYQTAGEEDMGHFEYRGAPGAITGELTTSQLLAAKNLAGQMPGSKKADAVAERQADVESLMRQGKSIDEIQDMLRLGEFGVEFTGTIKSAFDTIAANRITGTKRAEAQNVLEDKIAQYGTEAPETKDFIKRIAASSLGVAGEKEVMGNELLVKALNDISGDLAVLESSGVDTGILAGTQEEIARKIGKVADEDTRKLATKIQKTIQTYRRAVSGAAFTESESEEYKDIFPSIGRTAAYNTAAIQGLLESTQLSLDGTYSFVMGENEYNELFKGEAPVIIDATDDYINSLGGTTTTTAADDYINSLNINQ